MARFRVGIEFSEKLSYGNFIFLRPVVRKNLHPVLRVGCDFKLLRTRNDVSFEELFKYPVSGMDRCTD